MSKLWRGWVVLLLCSAASSVSAQAPPTPEAIYNRQQMQMMGGPGPQGGPQGPGPGRGKGRGDKGLDALENSLPTQNALELGDDSGNAFGDPGHPPEEEPFICWFKGEALQWMFPTQSLPTPLVTTVRPQSAINIANNFGALNQANTVVVFGNQDFDFDQVNGGRATFGINAAGIPFELNAFWLNDFAPLFTGQTDGQPGSPLFARPVLQTTPATETAFFAGPNQSANLPGWSGAVVVEANTNFWGIDGVGYLPIGASDTLFIDVLCGFKYSDLNEGLQIRNYKASVSAQTISFNGGTFPAGFTSIVVDDFSTRNQYAALQLGTRTILGLRRIGLIFDAKLAVGANFQELNTSGSSTLVNTGATGRGGAQTVAGGILAVPSNSGDFTDVDLSFMPEVAATAVLKLHRNVRLFATYSALYWSSVTRPGNHLDSVVDTRQVPTASNFVAGFTGDSPLPRLIDTDFFVHGFSFGVWVGF